MFCPSCGSTLNASAIFCSKCGTQSGAGPVQAFMPPPPPPPRPKKANKTGQWIALIFVIIALWMVFSRIGGSNSSAPSSTNAASNAANDSHPDSPVAALTHKIGDSVTVGYWSYRVYGSQWKSSIGSEYTNESPDAAFLVIDIAIRNNDKSSSTLPSMKLVDPEGREYDESSKAWVQDGSFGLLKSLNPNVVSRGLAIFDLPRGIYKLKVSGGYTSGENALIDLHK